MQIAASPFVVFAMRKLSFRLGQTVTLRRAQLLQVQLDTNIWFRLFFYT